MKRTKKIISIMLVLLMLIASYPIGEFTGTNIGSMLSFKASAASYNASAAVEYARRHAKNYNSDYASYAGKDCANFVSQCLYYGGLEQDGTWYPTSTAWINCGGLLSWLTGKGGQQIYPSSAYDIDVGDVLFTNGGGHVVICTGRSGDTIYFCGHTNDRLDSTISVGSISYAVKMNGIQTPVSTWDFSKPDTYPSYPGYYIKSGSTGSYVDFVQTALNFLGYDCGYVDGQFGSNTEAQVRNFQSDYDLEVDGVVGSSTWDALSYYSGVSDIPSGYYYIIQRTDWKHIENTGENVQIAQGGNDSHDPRQIWYFEKLDGGRYTIRSVYDNKNLDLLNGESELGTNVWTYDPNGSNAQIWTVYPSDDGEAYGLRTACGHKVLDCDTGSTEPGTNIQVWSKNNTYAQKFIFYPLTKDEINYSRPPKPSAPVLSVNAGSETVLSWTKSSLTDSRFDSRLYRLRIWQGSSVGEIDNAIYNKDFSGLTATVDLADGTYTARVTALNTKYATDNYNRSQPVTFTVKEHVVHTWELSEEKAATCMEDGFKKYHCTSCKAVKIVTVDILEHNYSGTAVSLKNGTHQYLCINGCENYGVGSVLAATENCTFGPWIRTYNVGDPCVISYFEYRVCSACGYRETRSFKETRHVAGEATIENLVEANCKHEGSYDEVYYCKTPRTVVSSVLCGAEISRKTVIIPKTDHTWDDGVITSEATCTTEGIRTYTCTICGDKSTENIPETGHNESAWIVDTNATCTESGARHTECTVCHTHIKQESIPALGHNMGEWEQTKAPTCTDNGMNTRHCTRCDKAETKIIPATGHRESAWIIDTNATCTESGARHTECTVCHTHIKQETIPRKNHTDKNADGSCDVCKTYVDTAPEEPSVNCSCNCHKSGMMHVIWKILNFFYKVFKIEKYHYCDCGVDHW